MFRKALAALACAAVLAGAAHAETARARPISPALFVARDGDSTMYLFGTVHVRRPGADWGGANAHAALAASEEVWTELEMSAEADAQSAAAAMRLGAAPADRPLSSRLTPEQNARVGAALTALGAPPTMAERWQPWFAGLMISIMPIVRSGYDPGAGVDRQIDAAADAAGKRMRWFETSAQQLEFFSGLSEEVQIEMLMESVEGGAESARELAELERAWERGDLRALERAVIDETRDDYPELYDMLFVRRNRAWTDVLMREMDGAGVDFVAVGAGHLLGDDGLVEMLRARGVRVERVR